MLLVKHWLLTAVLQPTLVTLDGTFKTYINFTKFLSIHGYNRDGNLLGNPPLDGFQSTDGKVVTLLLATSRSSF